MSPQSHSTTAAYLRILLSAFELHRAQRCSHADFCCSRIIVPTTRQSTVSSHPKMALIYADNSRKARVKIRNARGDTISHEIVSVCYCCCDSIGLLD